VIVAFNQLQVEMDGGAASVMGGISEALVATAAAISNAIMHRDYFEVAAVPFSAHSRPNRPDSLSVSLKS